MEPSDTQPAHEAAESGATPYEALRRRHLQEMRARLPALLERLDWPAERLKAERELRLQHLVRIARERSAWHRKRLAHVEPDGFTEDALEEIPAMTKDELMTHFDEIVTDPRFTLELAETHLANLKSDAYLFDRYHVNASGGASGRRGIAVFDWDGWAEWYAGLLRYLIRGQAGHPNPGHPITGAVVSAFDPTHASSALPQTFSDPAISLWRRFPVTSPFGEIVVGLNRVQPEVLIGYASILHRLAVAAQEGALRIAPQTVISASEPLLPEIRAAIDTAWSARLLNWWVTTEAGPVAMSCGCGPGMHLSDDLLIVEPVDEQGHRVAAGLRAAKVYVTNLFNPTPLPLIRYEITDEVTFLDQPCPCGSAHRLVGDILGRFDDSFYYPETGTVHPHIFRSRLSHERHIVEYQVRQTSRGAVVAIRCSGEVDRQSLRNGLVSDLRRAGLRAPDIEIIQVEAIDRQKSGKLKRFIPMPAPTD